MFRLFGLNRYIHTIKMSSLNKYAPPVNRHMTKLDKSFFITKVPLCVIEFPDPKNISVFSKKFKDYILRIPRIPHVIKLSESVKNGDKTLACDNGIVKKGVLLTDTISNLDDAEKKLSDDAKAFLNEQNATIKPYEYTLDYDYWQAEDILKSVLPEEYLDEIPTGFTITGHIAHLNLRKEFKPFDSLIGQVILDKNTKITCVVDKVSSIATKFRTFPMKIIAGNDNLIVEQKESNCIFKFDFSKVYWNSRLHTEHDRLVTQYFKPDEVVCDVFAGVGPFAVPAGKKGSIVLANDLNPESFKYLQENILLNKVDTTVKPFNLDGAEFIRQSPILLKQLISNSDNGILKLRLKNNRKKHKKNDHSESLQQQQPEFKEIIIPNEISHFVMNLPDSAIDFLGNFVGIYSNEQDSEKKIMPWIHVHCFEKYGNDEDLTMEELYSRVHLRILKSMNTTSAILPIETMSFHLVRKVSPTKPMFCVSYKLPAELAYKK
ncbi:similar to Saccharomyces cerevisiae YHR070W TRM5 tRNA(m(1)G37)methyltransferase, methylates a tRNA base adjacent to the anticodon that has a role in prevention of frameshifting [Maudiozyma saulgeensis]|uniref:tRNA (guanine(37)-N1)-methyltransferase n=1 Tax=Maudiozyma saulgeensis TaxID=1789683 RepID=A0A1X7R3A4_9SACH|nr:similar to Saccharomyces cerevisiae YHR070W TRM5 tRNA(m(1)G37)methyltransferase, methylates a tRNA base adjacent to the anticodon that has a role in prevention of frameshifting [Kazachstania saulgeensis]